jgi:hypothetical protein
MHNRVSSLTPAASILTAPNSDQTAPFSYLSDEIILTIFTNFNFEDLVRVCRVNRKWKALAEDESLWQLLCKRDGLNEKIKYTVLELPHSDTDTWKHSYQLMKMGYRLERYI